ncbi:MAG: glycine cleavage system protein GcvH [Candidatus Omnitrophica bacterium]|nr:glycine cleavage system protein GcvH [Candidatus Omnitrophota bacterium]
MNIPDNLFYTKEHEWAKIEGNLATIGITEYAQSSLGDIVFVECPNIKKPCEQFEPFAVVESVKAVSDVRAPLSGKIIKTNQALKDNPELINQSPYEKGWFVVIEIKDEKEKVNLLTSSSYNDYIKELSK